LLFVNQNIQNEFKAPIRSRPPLPQHVVAKGAGRQYQNRLNLENRMNFEPVWPKPEMILKSRKKAETLNVKKN